MVVDAVQRAGQRIDVGLVLIGTGMDSARIQRHLGGGPHIRMFRPVYDRERLARIMASADALVHGSEAEPFGMVASEAMAAGLPLIVPDTGGCAEVADPHTAELYTARDPAALAAAIVRFAGRDRALLRRAAEIAAGRVRSDREHVVELMAYYEGLVARGRVSQRAA